MEKKLNTAFGKSLRWLAVIPGAFLAMILPVFLFNLVAYGTLNSRIGESTTFFLFKTFLSTGLGSFANIYIGSIIAPFSRRIVSVSLCVIFTTLFILLLFMAFDAAVERGIGLWEVIVSALFFLAGSIIGVYIVWDKYGLKD